MSERINYLAVCFDINKGILQAVAAKGGILSYCKEIQVKAAERQEK